MTVDINSLVAAINPGLYCDNTIKPDGSVISKDVAKIVENGLKVVADKKNQGVIKGGDIDKEIARVYLKAAEKARLRVGDFMDLDEIDYRDTMSTKKTSKNAVEQHNLIYDAFGESLEPIYFWIIDNLRGEKIKLIDNFSASASSSAFGELGMRATKMQEEGMKILGNVNVVIKSILNIIYDLKEFKIRLDVYKDSHSKDVAKKNAALLSLKQIWMDQVDVKRGNTSLKGMAQQFDYVTLIDAFMASESTTQLNKKEGEEGYIDLNDRVKRLLLQRFGEYERWLEESEKELNKRFSIEKNYLKSQMASLKLYVKWLKPYLKAAHDLEMSDKGKEASLVTAFNTMVLELTLLQKDKYDPMDDILAGDMPPVFRDMAEKGRIRKYYPIMLVELKFRSAPERMNQGGYGFRGKVEVRFTSYALDDDEINILQKAIEEDDTGDSLKLIEEATGESMSAIEKDVDEFLSDKKPEYNEEEKKEEDVNPFSALFSFLKKDEKKESKKDKGLPLEMKKENYAEEVVRGNAIVAARKGCRKFYDIYKKAHGMPAFPGS